MDEKERFDAVYQYAVKVVAANDILRRQVEMVKFALGWQANTNGMKWARELLDAIEQVGRVNDD